MRKSGEVFSQPTNDRCAVPGPKPVRIAPQRRLRLSAYLRVLTGTLLGSNIQAPDQKRTIRVQA